ncbi:hypothetical protein Hanom_Chr00s002160g01692821 [Helianthus anomalus]
MEATPINSKPSSDFPLAVVELKTPNLPDNNGVTIAQLPPSSKTSPLAPLTPSPELSAKLKRKRLKPERLEFSSIKAEKKRFSSKTKVSI